MTGQLKGSPEPKEGPWRSLLRVSQRNCFRVFSIAATLVFSCVAGVWMSHIQMQPSIKQEWVVAILLLVGGVSFLVAMGAYFLLLLLRLRNFWQR